MFNTQLIKQFLRPSLGKITIFIFLLFIVSAQFVSAITPCGMSADDLSTPEYNEMTPCSLCPVYYSLKIKINFITEISSIIGLLALVIFGFAKVVYKDSPDNFKKVKSIVKFILLIIAAVFIIWIIVAYLLQEMGYQSMFIWNQINCGD